MAAISSLQIGGVTYDIYAKSAEQAPGSSHELSSHSHFSTYFNGTSANSALTSKSALSAGSASKAVSASGADSATFALSSNTARNGNFYEDSLGGVPATFSTASTYSVGAQVYTGGYCYSASAAVSTAGTWASVSSKFAKLTQVNWTITDTLITELYKGLQLWVKIPSYGGTSGSNATMLNINGSGAKQVRINNGNYTTHYGAGTIIHMTYDGTYFQIGDRTDGNDRVGQYSATDSQNYPIILKRTTGGQETQTVKYASAFTYNPSTSSLNVSNISSNNITATVFSGNLSGNASSAKNAGTATYATSAGAAPFIDHDHSYKLSGNGTAVNVSAGVNFKPSGSNIKFYVSGNDIYISAKNDNSTAYIPSGFQVSAINGTTTGVYYLSALKLNAGTNIGFTSASNSQITITAKDTTYTTSNFITANKTVGVSSNGTNVGTVNLSAISFSAGSNVALGTAANNIITITAKDTTYTSLNSINSTEYNALTSTSANSRNPNAHQLSSHTNFSTYFNGTSANTALTSKTALSAGIATKTQITDHTANDTDYAPIWTNPTNSSLFTTSSKYKFNPAAGRLYVSNIVKVGGCSMTWNASTSALDFNF